MWGSKQAKLILGFIFVTGFGFIFSFFRPSSLTKPDFIDLLQSKKTLNGFPLNLKNHSPEYYIINFWASWCPPCVEETPSLIRFVNAHANTFHLIAVSQDSGTKEIDRFLTTFPGLRNANIDVLWDDNRNLLIPV
jgi:thiol-disulfide isomerase/thioredoxin